MHLKGAHNLISRIIRVGDHAIDATCGNGWDTLFLAKSILTENSGLIYGFDIQETSINRTKERLQNEIDLKKIERIKLFQQSHEKFPNIIPKESISAIMYNLGYLPGSDKTIITLPQTTLNSIYSGLPLLRCGGIITILCYRGHSGGQEEANLLVSTLPKLDSSQWNVELHNFLESPTSPFLISIIRNS